MTNLDGKVALVTGGSRGIGHAIAERLAHEGALVAVNYAGNESAARKVVDEIGRQGGTAFAVRADVSVPGEVEAMFAALERELTDRGRGPRLDILVNNAGIAPVISFPETSLDDFDRIFAINVRGLFLVTQAALPRMGEGGRIINLSSGLARKVYGGQPVYAASKGAVNTLTLHLAQELGPRGITVNAIAPGAIDTDMNASWIRSAEGRAAIADAAALKRVGRADDIAGVAAFLASDDARWVTGEVIEASGGWHL